MYMFLSSSSINLLLYKLQRASLDYLDTLHIIFAISTIFFLALLIWYIVASISNRREEHLAAIVPENPEPIIPPDPFLKTDLSNYIDDTDSRIISDDLSGSNSYLISSSSSEEEVDLLEVESKLYDFSLDKQKDFGGSTISSSAPEPSSHIVDYGFDESSSIELNEYEKSSLEQFSPSFNVKEKKDKVRPVPLEHSRLKEFYSPSPGAGIIDMPAKSFQMKDSNQPDILTGGNDFEGDAKSTGDSLKIKLPKKGLAINKNKEEPGADNSRTRTAPLKAMRIDLPDKGSVSIKKKKGGGKSKPKKGRIDLPKKSLQ